MRYKEFKLDEDTLLEINMRPKKLRQAIKGMDSTAGIEFEMIVPNVKMSISGGRMVGDPDPDAPQGSYNWQIVSKPDTMNGEEGGEVIHQFHANSEDEAAAEFRRWWNSYSHSNDGEDLDITDFELRQIPEEPEEPEEDDFESEPDMDADESVDDIEDIRRFFSLDMNSERDVDRLIEDIYQDYSEWQFEVVSERWYDYGLSNLEEYIRHNVPANEIRGDREYDPETEDEEYTEEEFEKFVQNEWDNNGVYYDRVRDYFESEQLEDFDRSDEREWLRNNDVRYMSDLLESGYGRRHTITWPIWTTEDDNQSSSRRQSGNAIKDPDDINNFVSKDLQRVALDFMNGIGEKSIGVSQSYHSHGSNPIWRWDGSKWLNTKSDKKPNDIFVIEPDGSLQARSGDTGLEFVSPPYKTMDMIEKVGAVANWAKSYGCYAGHNERVGLHMNISVPKLSSDGFDFVKLAVLLGDRHILEEFGRINNTYTKPAISLVTDEIERNPAKAKELLDKVSNELNLATSKIFFDKTVEKFTSIHPQSNRIEFRSPGGDWINDFQKEYAKGKNKIVDTLMRVTVATDAATDPMKYKEEYLKKLYKLLPKDEKHYRGKKDTVELFADYYVERNQIVKSYGGGDNPEVAKDNAGFINDKIKQFRIALKNFVKAAQEERTPKKSTNWTVYYKDKNNKYAFVDAPDVETALEKATVEIDRFHKKIAKTDFYVVRDGETEKYYLGISGTWNLFLRGNEGNGPWKSFTATTLSNALTKAAEYASTWTSSDNDRNNPYRPPEPRKLSDFYIQKEGDQISYPLSFETIGGDERRRLTAYQILRASDDMPVVEFLANNSAEAQERLARYVASGNRNRFDYYVITKRHETQTQRYEIYHIINGRPQFRNGRPIQFNAISQDDAEEKLERYAADFNLGDPQSFGVREVEAPDTSSTNDQEYEIRWSTGRPDSVYGTLRASSVEEAIEKFHQFFRENTNIRENQFYLFNAERGRIPIAPVAPLGTDGIVHGSGNNTFFIFNPADPQRVIQGLQNVTSDETNAQLEYWNAHLNLPPGTLRVRDAESEDQNELNLPPQALTSIRMIPRVTTTQLRNAIERLNTGQSAIELTDEQTEYMIGLLQQEIATRENRYFEIYDEQTGNTIRRVDTDTPGNAQVALNDYISLGDHGLDQEQATARFKVRAVNG